MPLVILLRGVQRAGMTADEAMRLTTTPVHAVDLLLPSAPPRTLRLLAKAKPRRQVFREGVVLVESVCARPTIVDRIDMPSYDAEMKLSRYEIV